MSYFTRLLVIPEDFLLMRICKQILTSGFACERAIRPFVIGRKNWLMAGSPEGAKSSCAIYSLIETAKQNSIVPAHYLKALFEKAPYASTPEDWEKLLPWNIFKK